LNAPKYKKLLDIFMKAGLKRIEATLHNLGSRSVSSGEMNATSKQSPSFDITVPPSEEALPTDKSLEIEADAAQPEPKEDNFVHQFSEQGFSAENEECHVPNLPKFKLPNFTSHRNSANPALATNLLKEIYDIVAGWQIELQQVLKQIQDIYLEGPIVNGWLESHPSPSEETTNTAVPDETTLTATLRHCEVDELMNYVEEICANQTKTPKPAAVSKMPVTGYSLCGLDSAGKVWTRPCPPEQVASVSMAIARYQKLRQFLTRKQYLETRLSQLAETLILLHSHIQAE
jgi:hypothetical protein